ncbi:MAG TPA: hypothetical protein VGO69_12100, partial [Pyrinomonadaceae bacterium]|nr:hypothetical protein [Pyrinomonadaceae bacterium]
MTHRGSYTVLKRPVIAIVFCLLCCLSVSSQTRRNNRASSTSSQPSIIDIRQIDFRNFAYALNGKTYKLRDGFYAENIA